MSKKKIKEIFIGSNNKGKLKEIADLLPKSLKIYSNLDFKIPSPIETGTTFTQNSLLKARYFSKKTSKICLSDDSGIEIDILDKAPGVYSADWSGKKRNFNLAIKKVFREIYKKDKNLNEIFYYFVESFFRKNLTINNISLHNFYSYFVNKIKDNKIYNLDEESLLMELEEKVLIG